MARSKNGPALQPVSPEPSVAERKPKSEQTAREMPPPLPTPNWDLWGAMRQVKLFEAVMLSLDIAPVPAEQLAGIRSWTYEYPNEVARRLMIATNHLSRAGPLHPRDRDGMVTNAPWVQPELFTTVNLTEFSDFALDRNWAVPAEFPKSKPFKLPTQVPLPSDTGHIRTKGEPWTEAKRTLAKELVDKVGMAEAARQCGEITPEALRQQLKKLNPIRWRNSAFPT